MASTTKISKEAILDFINERIEMREQRKNSIVFNEDEDTPAVTEAVYRNMIMNQSALTAFESIRTLIQQGIFDVK